MTPATLNSLLIRTFDHGVTLRTSAVGLPRGALSTGARRAGRAVLIAKPTVGEDEESAAVLAEDGGLHSHPVMPYRDAVLDVHDRRARIPAGDDVGLERSQPIGATHDRRHGMHDNQRILTVQKIGNRFDVA